MVKKTGFFLFIFVTLLIAGSLRGLYAGLGSDTKDCRPKFCLKASVTNLNLQEIFIKERKGDFHIKVRYMGGECGYDPSSLPVVVGVHNAYKNRVFLDNNSFIFSRYDFLFKLRGPPEEDELA